MFASLKNKIREEIGSDISTVVRNAGSIRGINSRHVSQTGSTSSISGSQMSLDGSREDTTSPTMLPKLENELKLSDGMNLSSKDMKKLECREDEWRKRLAKKEAEFLKKLDKKDEEWRIKVLEKEKEWKKISDKQEKEKSRLEEDMKKAEAARHSLEVALRNAEEYKKKLYSFQEDAEQLEGFQAQEMAKIKHLLLSKEQEVEEKSYHLKLANSEIETLKGEVSRLRRYEDELNNVQESTSKELKDLKLELEDSKMKLVWSNQEISHLKLSLEGEKSNNSSLHLEVARLREALEKERTAIATLKVSLEKELNEKDVALLRNAQFSQDIELVKQENRQQEAENFELASKIENIETMLKSKVREVETLQKNFEESQRKIQEFEEVQRLKEVNEDNEKQLRSDLADLQEQVHEKNKTIKVLQQRLTDMKKTLQRELRVPSSSFDSDAETAAILNPSSSKTITARHSNAKEDDVNFKYLKHVLIKFLTSREYEALHLTRAVATLLHFSPEEERLLQETLEWKMSWFGTKPNLGFGQTAKAIPPS